MRTLHKQSLSAALLAALAIGCGSKGNQPAKEPSASSASGDMSESSMPQAPQTQKAPEPQQQSVDSTSTTTTTQGAMGKPDDQGGKQAPQQVTTLSDGEIIAIETNLNNGEIVLAELARKKATNAQVKDFAAMMITHHRDAQTKAKALAQKEKITPQDGDVSKKLKSDAMSTAADLNTKKGHDFDVAYIDSQVTMHRDGMELIDNELLTSVKNPALKDHLTTVKKTVATHLAKAQDIQSKLQAVGAAKATQPATKAKGTTPPQDTLPSGKTPSTPPPQDQPMK